VLGTGRGVLAGERGKSANRAERDDEKAEGRFQHCRGPVRRLSGYGLTADFFRTMSSIVSLVSSRRFSLKKPGISLGAKTARN
jgi:hypothetical protein